MASPEQVIADAIHGARPISVEKFSNDYQRNLDEDAARIARALRAAGLLPGPDEIVVSREALGIVVHGGAEDQAHLDQAIARLAAALLQPHPEETP